MKFEPREGVTGMWKRFDDVLAQITEFAKAVGVSDEHLGKVATCFAGVPTPPCALRTPVLYALNVVEECEKNDLLMDRISGQVSIRPQNPSEMPYVIKTKDDIEQHPILVAYLRLGEGEGLAAANRFPAWSLIIPETEGERALAIGLDGRNQQRVLIGDDGKERTIVVSSLNFSTNLYLDREVDPATDREVTTNRLSGLGGRANLEGVLYDLAVRSEMAELFPLLRTLPPRQDRNDNNRDNFRRSVRGGNRSTGSSAAATAGTQEYREDPVASK
jgi:hypothetical protein